MEEENMRRDNWNGMAFAGEMQKVSTVETPKITTG